MKLRNFINTAILFSALFLASCGATRRAGKDLTMVVLSPGLVLYGGGSDAAATATDMRTGMGAGAGTEVLVMPIAFVFHAVKHAIYAGVHAVDFVLYPFYGAADLNPYGPDIEPLDIYTGTWFDETDSSDSSGTDADSGESN